MILVSWLRHEIYAVLHLDVLLFVPLAYKYPVRLYTATVSRLVECCLQFAAFVKGMKPQDIINFIFFPVVNEGCRVVKEKIVDKASDLDVASVMAMGFPAARGGLIFWGDFVGAKQICSELNKFAAALPSVAGFFEPCDYLKQCAASGCKLADGPGARARL